jgi:ABC-2 type transport system ATP-binding protein
LLQELEADQIETLRARRLEIQARPFEQAQSVLARAGYTVKASDHTLCLSEAKASDAPDEVAALLVQAGVRLTRLAVHQEDLEAYFLRLTGEKS